MSSEKLYIYGIDLASGSGADYTGIVIHSIQFPNEQIQKPLPKLANLFQEKLTFPEQLDMLTIQLFPKYPPYYMVFDYTNEKSFTDMMVRDFGKDRVEGIIFGAGSSGTKKMLKDDGAFILRQGYEFPNVTTMRNKTKTELVHTLIDQLKHEEMKLTPSGRESFDHPSNRHNDLAISWELSIYGCLKFMLNAGGEPVIASADYKQRQDPQEEELEQYIPKYENTEDLFPELKNSRYKVNGMWSS